MPGLHVLLVSTLLMFVWDLILLSYVGGREHVELVTRSLRPGGMVILEAFHRDATKNGSIGGSVVFDTN